MFDIYFSWTCSGEEAYLKIRAGATLVQLYTAFAYEGPLMLPWVKVCFLLGGRSIGIISSLEHINFTMPCSYTNFQIGSIKLLVSHTSHNYVGGYFVFFYRWTMMLILRFKWVVRMDNRQNWQHVWSMMASSPCRMLLELTTTADLCQKQAIYIGILLVI